MSLVNVSLKFQTLLLCSKDLKEHPIFCIYRSAKHHLNNVSKSLNTRNLKPANDHGTFFALFENHEVESFF